MISSRPLTPAGAPHDAAAVCYCLLLSVTAQVLLTTLLPIIGSILIALACYLRLHLHSRGGTGRGAAKVASKSKSRGDSAADHAADADADGAAAAKGGQEGGKGEQEGDGDGGDGRRAQIVRQHLWTFILLTYVSPHISPDSPHISTYRLPASTPHQVHRDALDVRADHPHLPLPPALW